MQDDISSNKTEDQIAERTFFLGFFARRFNKDGKPVLRLLWKRALIFLACMMCALWVLKSVAIFCIYKYARDFDGITVTESFLFPASRKEVNARFGDIQIKQAQDALSRGDYQKAILLMKVGLIRSPANAEGRMNLAGFYKAVHQDDAAVKLLGDGLQYNFNNTLYLKFYMQTLLACGRDEDVRDYARVRLAKVGDKPTVPDCMIAYVAAQVEEVNGNFKLTLDYLDRFKISETVEGCVLVAKSHWDAEDREGAVTILGKFMLSHPRYPQGEPGLMLCSYLHKLGRDKEAYTTALGLANSDPKDYRIRKELIVCYDKIGETARAKVEKKRYIRDFADKPDALLSVADYSINNGDLKLANEVYYAAAEHGYNMGMFGMLMIESHISNGDFTGALKFCEQVQNENPVWLKRYEVQFNFLKAAAARALHQNTVADMYMDTVLNSTKLEASELLSMAKRMKTLNLDTDALALYEHARILNPHESEIISGIVELDLRNNLDSDFVTNIDELLNLRRPEYDLLRRARQRLTSDHFIFDTRRAAVLARLDEALKEPAQIKRI
jgi:tetratricopeptide (TPR) repeat protein